MSVRLRVTLAFTAVMALVLVAAGLFLYLRLGAELDAGIRRTLQSRSADITALVARSGRLADSDRDAVAQVLDPSGRVTDATHEAGSRAWLTPAQTRRALRGPLVVDQQHGDDHLRVRAVPASGGVVVVGEDLDPRAAAVSSLGTLLLIGGPVVLLLAALAGYGVAAAALRPVERMRARAAEIGRRARRRGCPVPAGRRRDRPPGRDAERDARAHGGGRSRASAPSSPTRATSCAPRWRSSRPSWSSPCAAAARGAERGAAPRRRKGPIVSPRSPKTC